MNLHEIKIAIDECLQGRDQDRYFQFSVEQDKISLDYNVAIQYNVEIQNCNESDPQNQSEPKIQIDFEHMILPYDISVGDLLDKIDEFVAELPEINYI